MKVSQMAFAAAVLMLCATASLRAGDVLYVAKDHPNASDAADAGRGSENLPYKTIQAAVAAAPDGATVRVAPGVYDDGGAVDSEGTSNRVYIAKKIYLVSTHGASETHVVGKCNSLDSTGASGDGDAMRCIAVRNDSGKYGSGSVIEGFTLRNGCNFSKGGAAFRCNSTKEDVYLVDCVISNCTTTTAKVSTSCNATAYGVLVRCLVTGNSGGWGTCNGSYLWNSVVCGNSATRCVLGYCAIYNCTVFGNSAQYLHFANQLYHRFVNSLVSGSPATSSGFSNNTGNPVDSIVAGGDHCFDLAGGDYRLNPASAAVGLCNATNLHAYISFTNCVAPIAFKDFYGNALPSNGVINAGAVQSVVPYCYAAPVSHGGISVSGIVPGTTNFIARGGSDISVTVAPDVVSATRPILGVKTNGVEVPLADMGEGISLTVPASGGSCVLEPFYGTNWYVNAAVTKGSDTNNGFTAATPKLTLAAALTNANLLAGDVVWVAPGRYESGRSKDVSTDAVYARAVVPEGVTLAAKGSAEDTFIIGADAPSGNANEYGCGTGAVRCVTLAANACVRGFTLTGGRACSITASSKQDNFGGGVVATQQATSTDGGRWAATRLVEDCVISNNAAHWGGGASGVTLSRCVVAGNRATRFASATYLCHHENSLIGKNPDSSA